MAEEIRNEEIMSEDELEGVAGGYGWEIKDDKKRFYHMGLLDSKDASDKELVRVFKAFGVKVETYHGDWTANEYKINGHRANRSEVWNYIYSRRR